MVQSNAEEKSGKLKTTSQFFVQSDSIESRKSAAIRVVETASFLDVDDDQQVDSFFDHVEHLLIDDLWMEIDQCPTVKQAILSQLPDLFRLFRRLQQIPSRTVSLTLSEQANLRLPMHVIHCFSFTPHLYSDNLFALHQATVQTLWELIDEPELLSREVVQFLIVPAIFEFFRESDENIPVQDNNPQGTSLDSERWFRVRVQMLSIIASLFSRSQRFSKDWLYRYLIPNYMEFYTGCTQMFLKFRELREVLAHSLINIAEITGTEFTDRELFPIFQRYMRDTPEVQYALLQHLSSFCKILSVECRENMIRELSHQVTIDPGDSRTWRHRVQFASQLTRLVQFFSITHINRHLSGFALAFSADRISEVRICGVEMLAVVLAAFVRHEWNRTLPNEMDNVDQMHNSHCSVDFLMNKTAANLEEEEDNEKKEQTVNTDGGDADTDINGSLQLPLTDRLLADIRFGFWRTRHWRRRQSFGRLLYSLTQNKLIDDDQFYYLFHHDLMRISDDDVANVRQYFCLLARHNHFDQFNGQSIRKRLERMASGDADLENRILAKIALGELDPEEEGIDLKGRSLRID